MSVLVLEPRVLVNIPGN